MKKMWKRFVSLLLACTLLAGMLPLSASAVSEPTEMTEWLQKKVEEIQATVPEGSQEYIAYGPFLIGDSELYQYTLMRSFVDDEGSSASDTIILILPGVNAENTSLPDYKNAMDDQPWEESFPSQIYIAEGVTGIGNYTFANNNNLKKVVFQDASDLTYVGSYAFNGDSRAQFTDEGNIDEKTTLNLSNVTKMGENAFYNCDGIEGVELSGDITALETNEDGETEAINNKIPNYAFGSCNALTSITVPEGIVTIGTAAFAGCTQASSITLPNSLVTIGDRAFACSIDGDNNQLTALTIPENVETIGASAFYGYTELATVTVESTVLKKPGDAAFGNDDMSAYSGQQTVGDVTVENGGTTFKTPNAEITKLFVNHDNCYLGPISPLTLIEEESYPAMCNKAGKNVYKYTFNNVDKRLEETLSPLQPHFTGTKTIPATCRQPAYYEKTCDQWFEKDKKTGKWVRTNHIHNEAIPVGGEGYKEAEGHAYEVTAISNDGYITEAGGSRVTFVCQNKCHSEERDGSKKNVDLTLTLTQQEATTLQKLSDITLPVLTNGTLEWNEPDTELDFDEDVQYFPVTFTPNQQSYGYLVKDGQLVEASECGGIQLTVGVKVEKVELDFSRIAFDNASVLLDTTSKERVPISVTGAPTSGLTGDPAFRYYNSDSGYDEDVPPARNAVWSGMVSVTYQYNSNDYWVDPNTEFIYGNASEPYTIEVKPGSDGNGTVTISHRYQIIEGNWDAVSAVVMQRTYGDDVKNTVHLIGVPKGATIEWRYASKGTDSYTEWVSQEMEETDGTVDIVPIQNAGDYDVEIKITYSDYDPDEWNKTLSVHVYKKAVSIPTAVTGLIYTGEEQTGVSVAEGMNDIYTLSGNTGTDATGYTATATLTENAFQNYCWQGRGEDQQTAEISWSIAKRSVMVPNVFQTREYQYNGEYQKIVSAPNGTKFEYVFPTEGTEVQGKFKESGIVAFTVTNGQAKDVGEYPITATLANGNYQWVGTGAPDDGSLSVDLGEWEITPIYLAAPAFTASGKEYDGQPYDPDTLVKWQDGSRDQAVAQVQKQMKGSDQFTFSGFVYNPGGATAPEDAGSYTIQAVYTYPTQNYVLRNNTSRNFIITQKSLTMQAPGNQKLTYTGASHEIQGVTVDPNGLVQGDDENAYIIKYSSQEWDKTLNDGQGGWSSSTTTYKGLPSLEYVGRYLITAKLTSKNYTAEDVTYEVEISIATQTVKLTQEDGTEVADGGSISKTLGNAPFTVTGKGYVNDVVVNADDIGYKVTGGDTQNPVVKVDANSGQVTLLRAGSATITVTAAGSANYQEATATYTITVGKGTPEIQAGDKKIPYDGKQLEKSDYQATVSGVEGAVVPSGELSYQFYQTKEAANNNAEEGKIEAPSAVGDYWLRVSYPEDANYLSAHKVVKVTITNADLFVTPYPYNEEYDGIGHAPATFTVKGVGGAALGTNDYTVYFVKKEGQYADIAPEAEAEGVWNNQLTVQDVADSGQFWYKIVADSYDPYVGEEPITATVNPKPLEIERKVTARKPYDGTKEAIVNIGELKTGVDGEEINVTETYAEYDSAEVDASSITITYTLKAGENTNLANYTVSTDGGKITDGLGTETVTTVDGIPVGITPAPIKVAINDQTSVYDGEEPKVAQEQGASDGDTKNWYVSEGTIYNSDNLGITLSVAPDSKDAGAYAITGKADNDNYKVTFTGNWQGEEHNGTAGTYTIDPRPIKVEIGDAEGFYGDEPVLDNVELVDDTEDGVSDAGLVVGEVLKDVLKGLELATAANAQSDISDDDITYPIYAKKGEAPIQAPTQLGNYEVTFTNEGTYTVKPRPITITIKDHSSVYGEKIDGGIADPDSGEDYTVAITGNATTGDAIVKGDNLEIKLTTEATADSPVDDYDITGSAAGEKVNNYAITWAGNGGNRDGGGKNGKYTIEEAKLAISFEKGNQVLNGVSINITDSYNANPLVLKNASTDAEVSEADKSTLGITYSIGTAGGGTGDVSQIAEIDKTTGEVTILKTGTVRITATVTPQGNSNYTGQVTTWYELNIISGGQMTLKVTPKTNLTYTGDPQALIETPNCSLEGATIQYSLNNRDWGDEIPTGINAGNYTVYVKATDPNSQYSDVTEHVMVTIDKATLEGSFAQKEYTHVLTTGNSYDSAQANELTISSAGYGAEPAKYTYRSADTTVAMAENGGSTIRIMGSAGQETTITVTVPGDNNYNEGTFTYTLKISDDLSKIKYNVTGITTTYNGQPQTIKVEVSEPDSGATVMYWNEETKAYDLSEPPAYTDVQDGGYTIKFQITAPGYEIEEGTATLKINPRDISQCRVEGIAESYTYVGHQIQPETVAVVDDSVILTKDTDYTLKYGANQEVGEGKGFVIIKGKGNYTGEVIEHFDIIPVDGSSGITASIAPNFGTYDPDAPVTAEVTVTHQTGSESHEVDLTATNAEYTISATDLVTGQAITDHGATGTGDTLTFTKPAIYDITLTLTGDHRGEFRLSYTLLPLSNDDGGLTLTVDDETQKVFTYGDQILGEEATIKVTANSTDVTDQCTLTYEYTGFDQTTASGDYNSSVLENAGVYTVTATPKDGSAITGTGTFTFLILQRDLVEADLTVEDGSLVYDQTAQEPSVTVAVTGNPTADDYTVTYYNNVNASDEAKAVVTAKGNNFTGSQTAEFTIAPKPITDCEVENIPDQYYTGKEVVPPVTIKDSSYTLILGYDYTTACEDKGPGAATVTIKGTGNYTGEVEKTFTIQSEGAPEPSERFDLAVTPSQWTWGDDLTNLRLSVTFGTDKELTLGTEYTLEVNGQTFDGTTGKTKDDALTYIKGLKPDEYTITATGVGAYNGSTDTETVTIQKIQPEVTVKATPNSLSGGGKVTLTLKGEKLPNGTDLKTRLSVTAKNDNDVTLEDLHIQWPEDGSLTAELTLPNTNETYTFALRFVGNDYYESASSNAMVVVGQQTSGGGGGSDPGDQPADPDDTGVSDWLNTKDHLAYLAGYPGGTFGPDQNMTRAEAAQMFYNLLLEKDVEITVEFEDVPADAWYAKPVNTLASLGILSGVGNGRFDPERSITRAEFTVIAMKFANTSGGGVNIFSDVNEDDWFYSAVVDSTQYGWINGYPDGTFRPEATISRAEVTVIVNHMLGRAADRPYVIAHEKELNTFGDVNRGHWGYFHIAEATNAHEYHTEDGTESWTGLS